MYPLLSKNTISTSYFLPLVLAFLLLLPDIAVSSPSPAEITLGPQGYASFASLAAFSTLKPCAQGCLKYNGLYVCGMAGWGDLGSNIGCGCSPQNYCFCDQREGPAVSSYIQSCVVTKCATPNEESAVLDLYNGYCATANIAVEMTSSKPYTFTGSTGAGATNPAATATNLSGSKSNNNLSAATAANTNVNTAVPGGNGQGVQEKKPALGIGAIIGIAVGGVVILGALMCVGCCVFWRKRSSSKKAKKLAATQAYTTSQTQQPVETTYVPGKDGAVQIDGSGVFGAKPKVEEKVKPYVVSPLHTPTQGFAAPVVAASSYTQQLPNNGQHEMYASRNQQQQQHQIQSPNVNHHEMYASSTQQQQQQQQQQYPPPQHQNQNYPNQVRTQIPTPNPNHHEMYAQPQIPAQTPQELYTHANQSEAGYTTQHQRRGNWIAAQLPADQNQGGQYGYQQQQQISPVQLSAGQDGIRNTPSPYNQTGSGRPVYEKP